MSEYIVKDTELTAVADAIRAKSGGSSQLVFPSGFVSEIGAISNGEPFPGFMTDSETITIGENSVNNTSDAKTYFSSYDLTNGFLYLVETPTVNNQLLMVMRNKSACRIRGGALNDPAWGDSAYDCKLIAGTHYVLWSRTP